MGNSWSVAPVPSPDEIRTGNVFIKNEDGTYRRFEGSDVEYAEKFVEEDLKHPLDGLGILHPTVSRFDVQSYKRIPSLSILHLYNADNKLQELNISVNEKSIDNDLSNTPNPPQGATLNEKNCSEALLELYLKPDRFHLRELEHCIANTYCSIEYKELNRHLDASGVESAEYLQQLEAFTNCAIKQPEFPHVQKMAEKLY